MDNSILGSEAGANNSSLNQLYDKVCTVSNKDSLLDQMAIIFRPARVPIKADPSNFS